MAPASVGANLVLIAGGFLVCALPSGKSLSPSCCLQVPVGSISTGTICLFDVTDPEKPVRTQISTDKKGWFYHKVVWYDVNGDGKLDVVAARATAPSNPSGELVWFEQPQSEAVSNISFVAAGAWAEHVVVTGPDVDFIFEDIDGDKKPEVVACQFFSAPVLAMYSCPEPLWSQCNQTNVVKTVIDDKNGPFFSVQHVDLNGDNKKDLLVTNNQDNQGTDGTGSVFGYEVPSSASSSWAQHVLATGFIPNPTSLPSPGSHSRGSPGRAAAFHPKTSRSGKPAILVSGDDAGTISVLTAVASEDSSDWNYTQEWVVNSTGTIGSPAVGDVDGDGLADIFVPMYSANRVEVYTFEESGPSPAPSTECVACLLKKDPVHLSPAYAWCYKDSQCHVVGSPANPCSAPQCASAASTSSCECSSCNDGACQA